MITIPVYGLVAIYAVCGFICLRQSQSPADRRRGGMLLIATLAVATAMHTWNTNTGATLLKFDFPLSTLVHIHGIGLIVYGIVKMHTEMYWAAVGVSLVLINQMIEVQLPV